MDKYTNIDISALSPERAKAISPSSLITVFPNEPKATEDLDS